MGNVAFSKSKSLLLSFGLLVAGLLQAQWSTAKQPSLMYRQASLSFSGLETLTFQPEKPFQWAQTRDTAYMHSPRKATLLAMALPGAGQIYNRKYWKAPIVYAGLGGSLYAIGMFRGNMRSLNDSIAQIYSLGKTPSPLLLEDRDNQRSRRDVAILCLAGVYVLQVLDAVVDAHFYKFNINDKIGIEWNAAPSRMLAFHYQL
ncbi:MAG: DUF5683 domain-containing protein [Bacteroidota bacterium]|jgi:hypothetical protein